MHLSKLFSILAAFVLFPFAIADPPTTETDPVAANIYDTCNNMIDMINGLVDIANTITIYSAAQYKLLSAGPYADILGGLTAIQNTIASAGSITTPISNDQEQQAYIQDCIAIVVITNRKLYDTLICKTQASLGPSLSSTVPGAIIKYDGATYNFFTAVANACRNEAFAIEQVDQLMKADADDCVAAYV